MNFTYGVMRVYDDIVTWKKNVSGAADHRMSILLTKACILFALQAARWRQEHRAGELKQRRLVVWEVDEKEPWEAEDSKPINPLAKFLGEKKQEKKVNVRDRVAGVLAQDRDDAWEAMVKEGDSD